MNMTTFISIANSSLIQTTRVINYLRDIKKSTSLNDISEHTNIKIKTLYIILAFLIKHRIVTKNTKAKTITYKYNNNFSNI